MTSLVVFDVSITPKESSPFVIDRDVVGAKKTPTIFSGIVPCANKLSVTVCRCVQRKTYLVSIELANELGFLIFHQQCSESNPSVQFQEYLREVNNGRLVKESIIPSTPSNPLYYASGSTYPGESAI